MSDCMAVLPIFEEMQSNGMPASRSYFERLSAEMWGEMQEIQSRISSTYFQGHPFNPGSPKDVGALLRRRGLKSMQRTSTGAMSTGKNAIEYLRYTDPAISDVFEWRERQHVKDSYCDPILARFPRGVELYDIRCQIKTTRVATRRLASADPNYLGLPSRTELGRKVRSGFIAREGEVFVGADLSQIEMRVAAHLANIEFLIQLLKEGRCPHKEMASRMFEKPVELIDKDTERAPAKTTGFGVLYWISPSGLLVQIKKLGLPGWDEKRCEKMIDAWVSMFPEISTYRERVKREVVAAGGEVRDHWGMPRFIPGILSRDQRVMSEAWRIAVSHRIQGMAQGMIQQSMIWLKDEVRALQDAGLNVKWRLQIHDELILTCAEEIADEVAALVVEGLTEHCGVKLRVPVLAESHVARNWGELK